MNGADGRLEPITVKPIGFIRSPHRIQTHTPIQPVFALGIKGTVEVLPEFAEGLKDIEGFSHIYLFFHFHKARAVKLTVVPFLDDAQRGVFATRAPSRPNHIGMSLVKLLRREGNVLHVEDVDILDGTPLLDIKPFIPRFDTRENVTSGWQEGVGDDEAGKRGRREFRE